jgi:hypothetical protein
VLSELKLEWSKDSTRGSFDGPAKFKLRRFPGIAVTSVVVTYGDERLPLCAGQTSSKQNEAFVTEFKSLEGSRPDAVAVRFKALLHSVEGGPRSRVTLDARRPSDASAQTVTYWVDLLDWLEARASAHAAARSSPSAPSAPPAAASSAAAAPRAVVGGSTLLVATPQRDQQPTGSQRIPVGPSKVNSAWATGGRSAFQGASSQTRAAGGFGLAAAGYSSTPASSSSSSSVFLLAKSAPSSALGGYGGLTK